ncbi:MAG: hypothetical protein PHW31_04530 [Candidatus Pacebacteria bacterium]|nr:hypothetical protein [Candidatus Paceibacterota bacterium]
MKIKVAMPTRARTMAQKENLLAGSLFFFSLGALGSGVTTQLFSLS